MHDYDAQYGYDDSAAVEANRLMGYVQELESALERISNRLDSWSYQSLRGGWSTHQVQSQRELAAAIRRGVFLREPSEHIFPEDSKSRE